MTTYRIGQAAELLGVNVETVRRWADAGQLETTRTEGGHRVIAGTELARFAETSEPLHEPSSIGAQSARNRLPGIVTKVIRGDVMAQVEVQAGRHRIVSLMSREAADEMALEPGMLAVAAVKATSVVVELPA